MERTLIMDMLTSLMVVLVFMFVWIGLFIGRKSVKWENNYEGIALVFMCLLMTVATLAMGLKAWFWFTEHIIYIP